ncbi:MAG: hypothetical protein MZV64_33965 [Ignavibacteriales bacterium]|nr:hypothetical protein [Ignavibacteriales bacterium]
MTGSLSLAATGLPAESEDRAGRDHERPAGPAGDRFEVGRADVLGRADEHRLGQLDLQDLLARVLGGGRGGQHGQAEDEQAERTGERLHRDRLLAAAVGCPGTGPALNILHVSGPVFTRAQTTGCRRPKPATSSVDRTMKAVDRASEAAADGWEAQAAACPAADRPVRGRRCELP